jgi:predicted ArsR family transcriptional regulator
MTNRQQQVLALLSEGLSARQIAEHLGVSRNAVYQHIDALKNLGALDPDYTPTGRPAWGAASRPAVSTTVAKALKDYDQDAVTKALLQFALQAAQTMQEQAARLERLEELMEGVAEDVHRVDRNLRVLAHGPDADEILHHE